MKWISYIKIVCNFDFLSTELNSIQLEKFIQHYQTKAYVSIWLGKEAKHCNAKENKRFSKPNVTFFLLFLTFTGAILRSKTNSQVCIGYKKCYKIWNVI